MITENIQFNFDAPHVIDFELLEDDPIAQNTRGLDEALGSMVVEHLTD